MEIIPLGRGVAPEGSAVGGKAEALDQLLRAGLPVPPGWVVTTAAYRRWLASGLADSLRFLGTAIAAELPLHRLLERVAADEAAFRAAEAIQGAIERVVPHRLVGERFVARSSAVGEDGHAQSFAGIYESFPGLRWEQMGAGVVLCWASAFSPRAESYRQAAGIAAAEAPVAALLQPLVPAVAAGVAFTADPTSGARSAYLVNAVWGLGTSLVDGRVQPDQFRIPRGAARENEVVFTLGEKALRDVIGAEGTVTLPTPEPERRSPALTRRRALELARMLGRLERIACQPQDVEWAWDGARLWLLQSRPITRLPEPPGAEIEWSRTNYRELYPELPAPLSSSYMEQVEKEWGIEYFRQRGVDVRHLGSFLKIYQGRPFINYSALKYVTLALGGEVESNLRSFGTLEGAAASTRQPELGARRIGLPRRIASAWRYWCGRKTGVQVLRYIAGRLAAAERIDPEAMSDYALVGRIEEAVQEMEPIDVAANDMGGALSLRRLLVEALVGRRVDSLELFLNDVTVSGPENVSVAQALDLIRLGALAREEEETREFFLGDDEDLRSYWVALASTRFHEELRAFLRRYGHRCLHESDSSVPRFREDPLPILRAVAAMVRNQETAIESPEQRLARQRAAAAGAWQRLWSRLPWWEQLLPARFLLARQTARTMRLLMRYREGFRSEMARLINERRRLETELGRRWSERDLLESVADVYWLRLDELRRATEERSFKSILRSIVRDRKAEYARLGALRVPNVILEGREGIRAAQAAPPPEETGEFGLVLRGQPVSSGITEGEVRVIERPEDATGMAPGTILVSPVVGPSWGALYSIAGGLIVEMGGALSHGAILAREYGLPAVTNIPGVTRWLKTGDRVLLNADLGIIWRAPERPQLLMRDK